MPQDWLCPEEARRILKCCAAERGESLNTYLLGLIAREVERPTVGQVLERAAARAERASGPSMDFIAAARMIVVDAAAVVDALVLADEAYGLTDFDDLPITRWASSHSLRRRAFQLRDNVSAHDAAYVVLAEVIGCPLLTRDARLSRSSGHSARTEVL